MKYALITLIFFLAATPANALDLSLICGGSGSAPDVRTGFGSATNLNNGQTAVANGVSVGRDHIADRVRVEISDTAAAGSTFPA